MKKRSISISERITLQTSTAFKLYLMDVKKTKLLTEEEETFYGKLAFEGDEEASNILVEANLRFVVSVAKQFTNSGIELQDLVNEGNIGLQIASTRFDPDKGFKFLTFAVWWIRHKINEYLSNDGRLVKLPLNKINEANEISKIINNLKQDLLREPSTDEILGEMKKTFSKTVKGKIKYDERKVADILAINANESVSLDREVNEYGDGGTSLMDLMPSPSIYKADSGIKVDDKTYELNKLLNKLTKQESTVIKSAFGLSGSEELTLEQIADSLDLTRERIRQIKVSALNKMKKIIKENQLYNI